MFRKLGLLFDVCSENFFEQLVFQKKILDTSLMKKVLLEPNYSGVIYTVSFCSTG